jgi:hypothetical protein
LGLQDARKAWIARDSSGAPAELAVFSPIALVLTLQIVVGAALGLGLLDVARDVTAFNLPARVGQLLGGSL